MFNHHIRTKYKPSIPRRWLFILAGALWIIAGGILCWRAFDWYPSLPAISGIVLVSAGILLALPGYYFGFSRLVRKNIRRISDLPDRPCLFAFAPWRGYGMILFMMSLGFILRHSGVPPAYLITLYTGMGLVLIGSGLRFWFTFFGFDRAHDPT